ncbi:MAG: hypothetical protein QM775_10340 [Pirellulales bacterium]
MQDAPNTDAGSILLLLLNSVTAPPSLSTHSGCDFPCRNALRFCIRAYAASLFVFFKRRNSPIPFISLTTLNAIRGAVLRNEFEVACRILDHVEYVRDLRRQDLREGVRKGDELVERVFMSIDFTSQECAAVVDSLERYEDWLRVKIGRTAIREILDEVTVAVAGVARS